MSYYLLSENMYFDFNLRKSLADSSIATASEQQKLIKAQTMYQKIQNVYAPYLNELNAITPSTGYDEAIFAYVAENKSIYYSYESSPWTFFSDASNL